MARYQHIKQIMEFFGVDLRSSDVLRGRGFASDGTQNVRQTATGDLCQRYGFKTVNADGILQLVPFETVDMLGTRKKELVAVMKDGHIRVLKKYSFTVTNSNAAAAALSIYYTGGAFYCVITRGGVTILNQSLGASLSLTSLRTAINAVSGLAMSAPDVGAHLAEYLDNYSSAEIAASGGTLTISYYSWTYQTELNAPTGCKMLNQAYLLGGDDYEGISTAVVKNVLYMTPRTKKVQSQPGGTTSASAYVVKYDGNICMRAGLGQKPSHSFLLTGASASYRDQRGTKARTAQVMQSFYIRFGLKQVDKAGNVVESALTDALSVTGGAGAAVYVYRFNGTLLAGLGYNYRVAKEPNVGTAGPGLTFTVQGKTAASPQELQVGDIAYFHESAQGRFIQREVTAVTTSSITLSATSLDSDPTSPNYDTGGNVSILKDTVFTPNLRMVVWRTQNNATSSDGPYQLVEEVPYYDLDDYADDKAPSALGEEYLEPTFGRDEPPVGRYLCAFNDQLMVGGLDYKPVATAFSDIESPEYFAAGLSEFDIDEPVTGVKQTGGVLAIGGGTSFHIAAGDFANYNFTVERRSRAVGVVSHDSMRELQDGLLAFLSHKGPYVIRDGRDLRPLGAKKYADGAEVSVLEPYFAGGYSEAVEQPVLKRAQACVHTRDSLYVLFVPHELPSRKGFATSNSRVYVFDFGRGVWWPWTQINGASGVCEVDGHLWAAGRSYTGSTTVNNTNVASVTWRQQRTCSRFAYADHATPTTWRLKMHWESLGQPSLFKRFLRCRFLGHTAREAPSVSMSLKTYVDYSSDLISTTDTITWTTQKDVKVKIKGEACRAMQVVVEGAAMYEPLPIGGVELEAVSTFREVMKE